MAAVPGATVAAAQPAGELPQAANWKQWLDRDAWRQLIIAVPYAWLLVFFVAPFLIVLAISFGISQVGIPPVIWSDQFPYLNWENYQLLATKNLYFRAY